MLTPDDVRNVVFSGAWRRERGYDEAEVDRFLARVEATLRGKRLVTARDVLTAEFSPRKKGARAYKKSQVDRFLDKVALTLMKLEVRDEDGAPRRHRLASEGGDPPSRGEGTARVRRRAEPRPDGPEQPAPEQPRAEQPAPELPAAQEGAAHPRRPERPDAETRRQLPQRRSTQSQQGSASGPTPAQPSAPVPAPQAASSGRAPAPPQPQQPPQPAPQLAAGAASASELVRDPARFGALEPAKSQSTALDKGEVDAFMDRVQATLRGADTISSKDVLGARFNPPAPGRPGYDKEGVIAFLKVISMSIQNLTSRNMHPVDPAAVAAQQNANGQPNPNGQGRGRPQPPPTDQRATSTNLRPVNDAGGQSAPAAGQAGAFPAQVRGDLRAGQQNTARRG